MTSLQQNKLSMYLAVLGVMAKYNAVWTAMAAIADMVTSLQDLTSSIQETSGVQGSPLTGVAGGKRRKRIDMIEKTMAIAGDVHALAVKNGDTEMQAKCDLELTDLLRLGATVVAPRCQEICDFANANDKTLQTGYGTEEADVTALQGAIDLYKPLITKPREAVVSRKEATGNIAEDEETADTLLKKELDKTMVKFKTKNAAFAGEYASARMIIDLGTRQDKAPATPPAKPA